MRLLSGITFITGQVAMAEITLPKITIEAHRVDIFEYERGWGSKLDEIKYFETESEAREFVKNYNSRNNLDYVPDWYMVAVYQGKVTEIPVAS